jgi:hypothetical protein
MDKRFAATAFAVLAVAVGGVLLANRDAEITETLPLGEAVSGIARPQTETEPPSEGEWLYLIREYDGRVAVFTPENSDTPEIVYDTLVKYLPDYDRAALREGIPVKDLGELVSRVEDYIS